MPRPKLPREEFISILHKYKSCICVDNKIAVPSNSVWEEIRKEMNFSMSAKAIYTIVLLNRYNVQEILELPCTKKDDQNSDINFIDYDNDNSTCSESSESSSSSNALQSEILKFTITLSIQEWGKLEPEIKTYRRGKFNSRNYVTLPSYEWTHIISSHFWDHTKLPCAISFKRVKIYEDGNKYLNIIGKCKECLSIFEGSLPHKPLTDERPILNCIYYGNYRTKHCGRNKRYLRGKIRDEFVNTLLSTEPSASSFRKLKANDLMVFGDCEPSHLVSANALRIAKSRALSKTRLHKDPIMAILQAKYSQPYNCAIKDIALDKFFVHYWTTAQIHVYRSYCENAICSKISVDATGGIVKKLDRPFSLKSGHIFLYNITVHDTISKKLYSVCNMLSERHDSDSIYHWLAFWIKDGAIIPDEVVADMSIALLSSLVRIFTHSRSLTQYINSCFQLLFYNGNQSFTNSYIRCDVAHVIHLISGWNCLKEKNRRIRQFYIRSLGQVLQAHNISIAEKILTAVLTVALSETEGNEISNATKMTECEEKKIFLRDIISYGSQSFFMEDIIQEYQNGINEDEQELNDTNNNEFGSWGKSLVTEVKTKISEGDRDNMQYLPEIVDNILRLIKLLPLCSAIMLPYFKKSVSLTGSSAPVESSFNDIKNRIFCNKQLPIRVDEFLCHHILSLNGTMKLAAAAAQNLSTIQSKRVANIPQIMNTASNLKTNVNTNETLTTNTPNSENMVSNNTCAACLLGNYPDADSQHKCYYCNIPIHNLDGCSQTLFNSEEGYGQNRACMTCVKKNNFEKIVIREMCEVENWRGQAITPVKRPRTSYLEPNIEWQDIDLSTNIKVLPICLLKNGNSTKLKPVKLDSKKFLANNTCAFDSLVQILTSAYCDSPDFKDMVDSVCIDSSVSNLTYSFYKLIKNLTNTINLQTYRTRIDILRNLFDSNKLPNNVNLISSVCTVTGLLEKLTEHKVLDYSCSRIVHCSNKLCSQFKKRTKNHAVVLLNNKNFLKINESVINYTEELKSTKCTEINEKFNEICNSNKNTDTLFNTRYLFIEISNLGHISSVKLQDIETNIRVFNVCYVLRGVIGYSGDNQSTDHKSIGHFQAYCLRLNNKWEIYDDLQEKKMNYLLNSRIIPHLLVYTL